MEELFKNFLKEYNLAMEYYEKGEYLHFFRNIRPGLEWLCKFIIADQVNGKCKPEDIFSGKKLVRRSGQDYLLQNGKGSEIKGRQLTETMFSSFMLNRKDVREARYDEALKGLRESMEMYSQCIRCFYSFASAGNHSSKPSHSNMQSATKHASILSDFILYLTENDILKEENRQLLKTLKLIKIVDVATLATIESEKKLISDQFIQQKRELDEALAKIEEQERLQRQAISEANDSLSEKEKRIKELEKEIELMKTVALIQVNAAPSNTSISRSNSDLDLPDDNIDCDQEDIILASDEESLLVTGCAGSGKSVIAMKKAKQLHDQGEDVITIAYTKSLNNYMRSGISSDIGKFYYHHQWKNANMPSADYIIVDEIQDFSQDEILEFVSAAKKHFFFFGDSAQSIYAPFKQGILSMEEISHIIDIEPMILYTNYRLPRTVAKITQGYVGVNAEPYSDRIYKNNSSILPCIIKHTDPDAQTLYVAGIISENQDKSIGILLPDNAAVLEFCEQLSLLDVKFEFKYELKKAKGKKSGYQPFNTLDFSNLNPKIMTYHSAKGLQFDIVILPWFKGVTSNDERKALYVAMTRTQAQLIVTYCDELGIPLNQVPEILYKKTL